MASTRAGEKKIIKVKSIIFEYGFTMVELLIYIALTGAIATGFIAFGLSVAGLNNKSEVVRETRAGARDCLEMISRRIRHASLVVQPAKGATSSILVLDFDGSGPDAAFYFESDSIFLAEGAGDPVKLVSDKITVSRMQFTNMSAAGKPDNIKIELSLQNHESAGPDSVFIEEYETAEKARSNK